MDITRDTTPILAMLPAVIAVYFSKKTHPIITTGWDETIDILLNLESIQLRILIESSRLNEEKGKRTYE